PLHLGGVEGLELALVDLGEVVAGLFDGGDELAQRGDQHVPVGLDLGRDHLLDIRDGGLQQVHLLLHVIGVVVRQVLAQLLVLLGQVAVRRRALPAEAGRGAGRRAGRRARARRGGAAARRARSRCGRAGRRLLAAGNCEQSQRQHHGADDPPLHVDPPWSEGWRPYTAGGPSRGLGGGARKRRPSARSAFAGRRRTVRAPNRRI